jgi:molybdenum cofactor guanylyltransferase
LDIGTNTIVDLQLSDDDEGIKIGRFVFDPKGFAKAQGFLLENIKTEYDWIIIDEIGRLEMDRHEGLEPAVSIVINHVKTTSTQTKLLLVVRDYLLDEVKKHYDIEDAKLLNRDFFFNTEHNSRETLSFITGVVLCGGQSVRMGRDKAFMTYHTLPQFVHVAEMMKPLCDAVFISCNPKQEELISQTYQTIIDNATFENAGPMTGVLSAFDKIKDNTLLVVGCDYPNFTVHDMKALLAARANGMDVVCFRNKSTGFDEPLLAIYEKQCAPLLLHYFQNGNTSLRHFLQTVNTKTIFAQYDLAIQSVDSPI